MEPESKETRLSMASTEPDLFLQWGRRRRPRCAKVRDDGSPSQARSDGNRRTVPRINCRLPGFDVIQSSSPHQPNSLHHRKSESLGCENRQSMSSSPEKDRYYSTRGSTFLFEENGAAPGVGIDKRGAAVLPRFFISLSNKEKEEDFLAMKGCKLPQRPKKRSKLIQKCLLLVSPGAWLSDLSQERYEVREKKNSRKRTRGLKAMCMESDSE